MCETLLTITDVASEWFGVYQIGQRVANRFTDDTQRIFIAGDVSLTGISCCTSQANKCRLVILILPRLRKV